MGGSSPAQRALMTEGRSNVRSGLLLRVGTLIVSPGRALADIQVWERGGVGDALVILLLGVLCFRLPVVARAVLMLREASLAGTLAQLLSIVGQDLRPAILIALPAAIATTVLAGRGRRGRIRRVRSRPRGLRVLFPFSDRYRP